MRKPRVLVILAAFLTLFFLTKGIIQLYTNTKQHATENFTQKKTFNSKFEQNRVFILNDTNAPRLCPALAAEIGLNESILFLQLEFWIAISNNAREGRRWTYQTVRKIRKTFPFWGLATINRAIHSLVEQELVIVGNFNLRKQDKTRWFAINFEKAKELKAIVVSGQKEELVHNGTSAIHNGTSAIHNGTSAIHNGTTIPETSSEITSDTQYKDDAPASSSFPVGVGEKRLRAEKIGEQTNDRLTSSERPSKKTPCPRLAEFLDGKQWSWARDSFGLGSAGIIHITRQFLREQIGKRDWDERRTGLWRNCIENRAPHNPQWLTAESLPCFAEDWWSEVSEATWPPTEDGQWDRLFDEYNELDLDHALRRYAADEDGDLVRSDLSDSALECRRDEIAQALRDLGWTVAQRLRQQKEAA